MDNETFSDMAESHFLIRLWSGIVIGCLAVIIGIIGAIIAFVKGENIFGLMFLAITLVGALVGGINGYIIYNRKKSK